jgi:uncharacterized protein (DUF1684 family)
MKANTIMTELEPFRAQKDTFFKTHPQSPLLPEQQETFGGLRYFPENPALRLLAAGTPFAALSARIGGQVCKAQRAGSSL